MRQSVPFTEEGMLARDVTQKATTTHGKIIDEILTTQTATSSWEEFVSKPAKPVANQSKVLIPAKKAGAGSDIPTARKTTLAVDQPAYIDWIAVNNGHCLRINICGRMDLQLRGEWQKLIQATAASDVGQFEFNLTQTPELSLTGLGLLLLFKEQKKSQRQDIKLSHCNRQVRELLQWTGMDKYFLIQGNPGRETKKK